MSNIVNLAAARAAFRPETQATRTAPDFPAFVPCHDRSAAPKRNRNSPYRKLWQKTEMGFVELNKVGCVYSDQEREYIRKGVAAARELAGRMEAAAEALGLIEAPKGRETVPGVPGAFLAKLASLSAHEREIVVEMVNRLAPPRW